MIESTVNKQTLLKTIVACELGPVREHNEDSLAVEHGANFASPEKGTLLVLADGMGGVGGGDVASRLVTNDFPALYFNSPIRNCAEALVQSVGAINAIVHKESFKLDAGKGMGTTLVASAIVNECLVTVNVGDSRAYLFRAGVLRQLSRDHSLRKNYFAMFESANSHQYSHVLTQAIGPLPAVTPHVNLCKLLAGDIVLLCSDGLTSVVADTEMCRVLSDCEFESVNDELLRLVVERNGDDNVSIMVAQILEVHQCAGRRLCSA